MDHAIFKVVSFEILRPYTVRVTFNDCTSRTIDFSPVLEGELYAPLRDRALFDQVTIDPEVQTLVWPNGADFDPATLHDWPEHEADMIALARRWASATTRGENTS